MKLLDYLAEIACFLREIGLFFGGKFCHDFAMPKIKQLRDLYRFPGFVPIPRVRGIFGDPRAVVISFNRCRKKQSVASVVGSFGLITTNANDEFAISPAATNESISPSGSDEYSARSVGR